MGSGFWSQFLFDSGAAASKQIEPLLITFFGAGLGQPIVFCLWRDQSWRLCGLPKEIQEQLLKRGPRSETRIAAGSLWARTCAGCLACIIPCTLKNQPHEEVLYIDPFPRRRNWGPEKFSPLHLISGRDGL